MKFLLAADLHIAAAEKEYSLAVLDEITGICGLEKCDALLLGGDIFDSWADAEALRGAFRTAVDRLPPSCTVYYLPGNHEELRAPPGGRLENFDFGRVRLLCRKPWSLEFPDEGTELLAIPFAADYSSYREWGVPPKARPRRLILAHGTVAGIAWTGTGEEDRSFLDPDIFAFLEGDLAALGHLHGAFQRQIGKALLVYPGSARVWREGEGGPRQVFLGTTADPAWRLEARTLRAAGEYRPVTVHINPDGSPEKVDLSSFSEADWLRCEAEGFVEDEGSAMAALRGWMKGLEGKYRRLTEGVHRLSVVSGISSHPLGLQFLKKWEALAASYRDEQEGVYDLARIRGLSVLKEILERRK
ncbi:MAG: metallophosphoesterase [Treponema sp.]|jgi:predicted phosphodiesterase|nr:metallophosphoesterase [Treponema sp.]